MTRPINAGGLGGIPAPGRKAMSGDDMTLGVTSAEAVTKADPLEPALRASRRELWSWEQGEREAIQLEICQARFEALRPRIAQLAKLAELQHVEAIEKLDDLTPLLFQHTVYKSYPVSLITKGRFDLMTRWLDGLTSHDLSQVDVAGCTGFDEWFVRLEAQSPLRPNHSTGTTGKLSIVPRDVNEAALFEQQLLSSYEPFEDEPNPLDLLIEKCAGPVPIVHPSYRHGRHLAQRMLDGLIGRIGSEETTYVLNHEYLSADMMSLVGQVRGASARGELNELAIAPELLARYRQMVEQQASQTELQRSFFERLVRDLQGQPAYVVGVTPHLYDWTLRGEERGLDHLFAPESIVTTGGGMKGAAIPDDWQQRVERFIGARLRFGYGMSEALSGGLQCAHGNYHPLPFTVPFVLDLATGAPKPRTGTQVGRYAFMDLLTRSYWGGFVTGDKVTVTWDGCACGRRGPYFHPNIERLSEAEGGDDKVSCSGSVDAHKEAVEWLVSQTGVGA
jgi:hypothetical protein